MSKREGEVMVGVKDLESGSWWSIHELKRKDRKRPFGDGY